MVKTPPFHGGIMGSSPVGVTKKSTSNGGFFLTRLVAFQLTRFARGLEPMETLSSLGKYTSCACPFSPRYHGSKNFSYIKETPKGFFCDEAGK